MRLAYKWQAAIVVAIGLFMGVLDNTIVSVALPQIQAYYHTDRDTITWVATAYFLAQAAIIPITGYLSDRIGSKTVFVAALAIFTVGSGLCAIAPNEKYLIAFRVFQGIGGGALFPTAFAIVFRVFAPAERGPASALIGVPVLLAPAFGPTIGGYFTTAFAWQAIFTINLPIGIVAFLACLVVLRGDAPAAGDAGETTGEVPRDRGRFDVAGLILSMVGFTALVYGISRAGTTSWTDRTVDIALATGAVLLIVFAVVELLVSDPVMDIRLFLNYTFTMANILTWALSAFLFGSIFLLPIFFQTVQGHSALESGEYVILQGVGAAVATVIAGRLYNALGPRILAVFGFILLTAGTYGFTQLATNASWQSLQVWMVIRGLGLGFTNIPLQTLVLSVVSNRAMARASSLVNVTRQVFGAVGLAALTTYFVQQSKTYGQSFAPQVRTATQAAVEQQVQSATQAAVNVYTAGSPFDPTTSLGHLTAYCAAPFGAAAQQHAAQIQVCVQGQVQQFAQAYGHAYALYHGPQIAARFSAQYIQQHVLPLAATHALNDTFIVSMIGCAVGIAIALFLGRDPAVEAAKRAAARGEPVEPRPAVIGE